MVMLDAVLTTMIVPPLMAACGMWDQQMGIHILTPHSLRKKHQIDLRCGPLAIGMRQGMVTCRGNEQRHGKLRSENGCRSRNLKQSYYST